MAQKSPTPKQRKAAEIALANPTKSMGDVMREAGYSEATAINPGHLTESDGWNKLMEKHLSDEKLSAVHESLLNSHSIDHMVFPQKATDEEIKELLATANCTVKKIMKSDMQTHVWFWSPDNRARKDGLDMAYKLKGKYAAEKKDVTVTLPKPILDGLSKKNAVHADNRDKEAGKA